MPGCPVPLYLKYPNIVSVLITCFNVSLMAASFQSILWDCMFIQLLTFHKSRHLSVVMSSIGTVAATGYL